jgi:hypothetical protein
LEKFLTSHRGLPLDLYSRTSLITGRRIRPN